MHLIATNDEISEYLDNIIKCIEKDEDNLIIAQNRDINLKFMIKYSLNRSKIIQIIKGLNIENFEEKIQNEHKKYSNELLYIFSKNIELTDSKGIQKIITVYIKFNYLKPKVILISFHEAKYKFKEK